MSRHVCVCVCNVCRRCSNSSLTHCYVVCGCRWGRLMHVNVKACVCVCNVCRRCSNSSLPPDALLRGVCVGVGVCVCVGVGVLCMQMSRLCTSASASVSAHEYNIHSHAHPTLPHRHTCRFTDHSPPLPVSVASSHSAALLASSWWTCSTGGLGSCICRCVCVCVCVCECVCVCVFKCVRSMFVPACLFVCINFPMLA